WMMSSIALAMGSGFNNIVNRQYIPDYVKFLATGVLALSTFASAFSIGREVDIEIRREFTLE
ncbi:hypothetical protein, partial [Morganella morganii]|uniref:hypothetical protein n=1 Tax=Morganella morganii TaxID=582 RepID=UPI0019539855